MKIIILAWIFFTWTPLAFAGGTVGNGGDVIVCKDGRVELLDIYEAKSLRGFQLDLGDKSLTLSQKVNFGISRISKLDPSRAAAVAFRASRFLKETKFLSGIDLKDIDDSDEVFLPAGCERKQIAIQNKQVAVSDPFYVVDLNLWNKMDLDNQAALILHEAIFAASQGKWQSSLVRLFNSVAFSNYFDHKMSEDYYAYVVATELAKTLMLAKGSDGRWYYQYPLLHSPILTYFDKVYVASREIAKEWDWYCAKAGGSPVMASSLADIRDMTLQKFSWMTVVGSIKLFGRNDDGTNGLYKIGPGSGPSLVNPADGDEGEFWCVSDKFPFEIPEMKE